MTSQPTGGAPQGLQPTRYWKRLRWLLLGILILLAIPLSLVALLTLRYHRIVAAEQAGPLTVITPQSFGTNVNPFIATGGWPWVCGHDFPGATTPFGMVRLGPETVSFFRDQRALNTSGYYYGDDRILGFSHTRLIGTGATDGGHCLVTPASGSMIRPPKEEPSALKFSHAHETASPGYYAVRLPEIGTLAELTATPHAGIHRYTFPPDITPHLRIDVTHALGKGRCSEGSLRILAGSNELEGSAKTFGSFSGRYGGIRAFFVVRINPGFTNCVTWTDGIRSVNQPLTQGAQIVVDLALNQPHGNQPVTVKVGMSFVSLANARANLDTEAGTHSFEALVGKAQQAWEKRLSSIRVKGGTPDQRTIFYSALYRTFQMPTLFADTNGDYMGFDGKAHVAEGFRYFTDLSLWDTFRTVHPLFNLVAREDQRDMIISLLKMQEQGGWLPRWPSGHGYSNSMLGTPADIVIAESYLKGIRGFDVDQAYDAMRLTALSPTPPGAAFSGREGLEDYLEHGYCAVGPEKETVARTLEFAWSDHAIARLATELGKDTDAKLFNEHALNYRNLWNPQTQYFQPRYASGTFFEPFKPLLLTYLDRGDKYTRDYVEGSAQQWRWMVPHDPQGLIRLFKNKTSFVAELNEFFARSKPTMGAWNPGPQYWHGNEPDIHAAYLFNEAGRPDLTQKWVRWILQNKYANRYNGLDGNDDAGTLSAWYVFSALGLYPVAGTDLYQIGIPSFQAAELDLGTTTLVIKTSTESPMDANHVDEVRLNGERLAEWKIRHADLANGGVLEFDLSIRQPNEDTRELIPNPFHPGNRRN